MHADEEIAGHRSRTGVVAVPADPQLRAVLDTRRNPQANSTYRRGRPLPAAAGARLPDAGRTGLDLEDLRDVEV